MSKAVVLGLAGLRTRLVQRWLDELPQLRAIQGEGIWGNLESTVPPSGPPAWISLLSGRNPGAFGIWDDSQREGSSYAWERQVDSTVVGQRIKCLHHLLPKMAQRVALVNVPYTWPSPKIPGGFCLSPSPDPQGTGSRERGSLTWPEDIADEVKAVAGEYDPGALSPGRGDPGESVESLWKADGRLLSLTRWFIEDKSCDLVVTSLAGLEAAAGRFDPEAAEDAHETKMLRDYYRWIDGNLGALRGAIEPETAMVVFAPYGVQRSRGTVLLNEWLTASGYLVLQEYPSRVSAWGSLDVDWERTRCWSRGNSGQLYINLAGREPRGAVHPGDYDGLLAELSDKLGELTAASGGKLPVQVTRQDDLQFGPFAEEGPDLFVAVDGYAWRTDDRVGYGRGEVIRRPGAEDQPAAAHQLLGYFAMAGPGIPARGELADISLLSLAPTIIDVLGQSSPPEMERPSILTLLRDAKTPSPPDDEQKVRSRLEALGY
jgi:predicted AlkP superfamily phosphohydrolase/phosphomutase